jgi:hypothetical protein
MIAGGVAQILPYGGRPNSRVTRGPFGSLERQTVIHIEFEATVRGHMLPDQRRAYDQNLTTQWHVRYDGPGIIIYLPKYLESDAQAVVAYSDDVNKRFRRCE